MILPTVHQNGTPADALIAQLTNASSAINTAYLALKLTAPNGRDYYTQGGDAFEQAQREHMGRLERLDAIRLELDTMTMAIDSGGVQEVQEFTERTIRTHPSDCTCGGSE